MVRAERWQTFCKLFSTEIDIEYREPKKVVEVLFHPSWGGGGSEVWNLLENKRLKTPLSDHLHHLFSEWATSFATLMPDFEMLFERFEVLGAFAYLDMSSREQIDQAIQSTREFVWMPMGRAGWHERIADKIIVELQKEPMRSELLGAGFAKGNVDRLVSYVTNFKRMADRLRWT